MLLILAPSPDFGQNDGYMQRVREIDTLLKDTPRAYLEKAKTSSSTGVRKLTNNSFVFSVPPFCDHNALAHLLLPFIDEIYIHSIYQYEYNKIFLEQLISHEQKKIFLDMHGVVPEEILMVTGSRKLSKKWQKIEKRAVEISTKIICVTEKMKKHLESKYAYLSDNLILLPIIRNEAQKKNELDLNLKSVSFQQSPLFIYAGGAQKWQMIEEMANAINKTTLSGYILSPNFNTFSKLIKKNVQIKSCAPDEVIEFLTKAHFSFVLREEHIVNKVACPTKLIEAMAYGCIPIVKSPLLGDFLDLGFKYISIDDFNNHKLPSVERYTSDIIENRRILNEMLNRYEINNRTLLKDELSSRKCSSIDLKHLDTLFKKMNLSSIVPFIFSKQILSPKNIYKFLRFFLTSKML